MTWKLHHTKKYLWDFTGSSDNSITHYVQITSQLTFTCSNSTTETLEKDVKYVQS